MQRTGVQCSDALAVQPTREQAHEVRILGLLLLLVSEMVAARHVRVAEHVTVAGHVRVAAARRVKSCGHVRVAAKSRVAGGMR